MINFTTPVPVEPIILPSLFLSIFVYFAIIFFGCTHTGPKFLRKNHFEQAHKKAMLIESLKSDFLYDIYRYLSQSVDNQPREDLLDSSIKKSSIRIKYETKEEPKKLQIPIGVRQEFQRMNRSILIKNIYSHSVPS